jgi:hypothetical protein
VIGAQAPKQERPRRVESRGATTRPRAQRGEMVPDADTCDARRHMVAWFWRREVGRKENQVRTADEGIKHSVLGNVYHTRKGWLGRPFPSHM